MTKVLAKNVIHDKEGNGVTQNIGSDSPKMAKQRAGDIRVLIGKVDPGVGEKYEYSGRNRRRPEKRPPNAKAVIEIRLDVAVLAGLGGLGPVVRIFEHRRRHGYGADSR
jgi:uncharacterized protein (DUF4415 family)